MTPHMARSIAASRLVLIEGYMLELPGAGVQGGSADLWVSAFKLQCSHDSCITSKSDQPNVTQSPSAASSSSSRFGVCMILALLAEARQRNIKQPAASLMCTLPMPPLGV